MEHEIQNDREQQISDGEREISDNRYVSAGRLWKVLFVWSLLLSLGVGGLYLLARQDAREARRLGVEESQAVDVRICEAQNNLRMNIREFVVDLGSDPGTIDAVNTKFKRIPCDVITRRENDK